MQSLQTEDPPRKEWKMESKEPCLEEGKGQPGEDKEQEHKIQSLQTENPPPRRMEDKPTNRWVSGELNPCGAFLGAGVLRITRGAMAGGAKMQGRFAMAGGATVQ
jgi:hypothetical protein